MANKAKKYGGAKRRKQENPGRKPDVHFKNSLTEIMQETGQAVITEGKPGNDKTSTDRDQTFLSWFTENPVGYVGYIHNPDSLQYRVAVWLAGMCKTMLILWVVLVTVYVVKCTPDQLNHAMTGVGLILAGFSIFMCCCNLITNSNRMIGMVGVIGKVETQLFGTAFLSSITGDL